MHQRGSNRFRYLYLVRHGDYVLSEEHFGGVLTERGRAQTATLADYFVNYPVDAIHSSCMNRAYETALGLRDRINPEFEVRRTPWLNERLFPGLDRDRTPEYYETSMQTLDKLCERFLRPSRSERHDVLVCHGNLIRALVTRVLEAPIESWIRAFPENCGVTQILCRPGKNTLLAYNERGHIPFDLRSTF